MADTQYGLLALIPSLVAGLFFLLYRWRHHKFAHIPSPMSRNLFLGHLGHIGAEYKKLGNPKIHPDYVFESILRAHGSPDYLFFDTRPAQRPMVLIASHELAEQISKATKEQQYSTTKSPTIQEGLGHLIGKYSMICADGETWKDHRKRFNPAFAPQHLITLLPVVVKKTYKFMEKLDALAKSGIATELESACTNVTFDIMGEVITNIDCKAQDESGGDGIVSNFRVLSKTSIGDNGLTFSWANLPLHIKRWFYTRRMDAAIKKCVQDKYDAIQAGTSDKKDRSVLALALNDIDILTPVVLQSIADQVKTFLFAGHDTTSILLQRVIWALSIHPTCLAKVRAEHDAIFGNEEPRDVLLSRPDETIKALAYTSACIKEALRLWPPAGSARMSFNGLKLHTSEGEVVCLDNCVLYLCHHVIQRDPKVYGETTNDFIPERWIGDTDTSSAMKDEDASATGASKVPVSAWRPFERGPRNCIGQELANLEARVILACVLRRYDFIKVGVGEVETDEKGQPIIDEKGKCKTKSELLSTIAVTSKVIDRTVMQVKLRQTTT